jgi:hypothetical protein
MTSGFDFVYAHNGDKDRTAEATFGALNALSCASLVRVTRSTEFGRTRRPSFARLLGKPEKVFGSRFRVSPRHLLFGVSLPGGGTGGVSVDERVEGASGMPTWFVLLDVDQVEQAAQFCPLVERHLSVASFDDPNQAPDEVDGVRTVILLAVSSVQ